VSESTRKELKRPGLVILNPVAGDGNPDAVRDALSAALPAEAYTIYETTRNETLGDVARAALTGDIAWVAAAGGTAPFPPPQTDW
jgi:diacylglycerol kinase family enzyme